MSILQQLREDVVNRFCVLSYAKQARTPEEKELEALRDTIQSWYVDLPADQTAIALGTGCEVQIGEKTIVKSWTSQAAVSKAVGGAKAFLKLATVTFKALSGVIGNTAAEALQVETQTGWRKLTAVAKLSPVIELPQPPRVGDPGGAADPDHLLPKAA